MQRSSELTVALSGNDPSQHMMELVFGDFQREYAQTGAPRPSSSHWGHALSAVVRRITPTARRGPGTVALAPSQSSGSFSRLRGLLGASSASVMTARLGPGGGVLGASGELPPDSNYT